MQSPSQQLLSDNNDSNSSSFARIDSMNGNNKNNMSNGGLYRNNSYQKYSYNRDDIDDDDDEIKADMEFPQQQRYKNQRESWNGSKWQYKKLYTALKDLEKYNVKISVPEFVFLGFQSCGKTSAVSQAAKLPLGVMKHGTASRCPTRFKLISNPLQKQPLIKVNGKICKNECELTQETMKIHAKYEEKKMFSKDIIEVRIEWCNSPELTFVDLPGLITGDNEEFLESKKQIDQLTASFLHETTGDGSYKYMPILVREPNDKEHDKHEVIKYINNLIENDTECPDYKKRIGWKASTLFIVNKFDRQISRSPASNLIEYMKYVCNYGDTVLTMLNPFGENTSTMNHKQLYEFVLTVPSLEEDKWKSTLKQFKQLDDENLYQLIQLKNETCGINKMNEILEERMCEIAKKCIPSLERQLELATKEKEQEISSIIKQIEMCNPLKLKTECIQFGTLFMRLLKEFYNGSLIPFINPKYKKSWAKEVNDFHIFTPKTKIINWKQEIQPNKLIKLLSNPRISSKPKVRKLLSFLQMNLMGSSAVNRMIDAWKCQVGYMLFPIYTDEDIVNIAGGFDSCRQPPLWTSIRNVVLASVGRLGDSVKHLAEMFRYKLKENADIIFEHTLIKKYGKLENLENNAIIVLLQRTLRDYKKEIDSLIDEFNDSTQVDPKVASILDQELCEETVLIGRLISRSIKSKDEQDDDDQQDDQQDDQKQPQSQPNVKSKRNNRRQNVTKKQQQSVPSQNKNKNTKNNTNNNDDEILPHLYSLGYDHGDIQNALQSVSNPKDINEIIEYIAKNDNNNNNKKTATNRQKQKQKEEEKKEISDEETKDSESTTNPTPLMGVVFDEYDNNYNSSMYDNNFFESMNANDSGLLISMDASSYDVNLIKKLSCIFYQVIKQRIIRDVITKVSNRIMRHVTQDNRLEDAVHTGVDRRSIQRLLSQLVDKTGIDTIKLEELIKNESTIKIPRSINDLDNEELKKIYGIDRERLEKVRKEKIQDLQEYNLLKTKTLTKIYHIKNNQYDKIQNDEDEKQKEEEQEQDISDELMAKQNQNIGNNISQ